jgi:hypothetical protein
VSSGNAYIIHNNITTHSTSYTFTAALVSVDVLLTFAYGREDAATAVPTMVRCTNSDIM